MDAQGDALAAGLVAGDALDVDHVLEAVDGGDLALTALVGATDDGDLVVLADGDAANLLRRRLVSFVVSFFFLFCGYERWWTGGDERCTSRAAPC